MVFSRESRKRVTIYEKTTIFINSPNPLTTPVPLNVIACGGTKTPPVVDDTDYLTLAQTAKAKIQTEFANFVNEGLNLRTVGDVTNGAEIMSDLQGIGQTADKEITQKDSPKIITGFLEILKAQVLNISIDLFTNYPELKPLDFLRN